MLKNPAYVFDNRGKWVLVSCLLWGIAVVGIYLIIISEIPPFPSGGHLFSPVYPFSFAGICAFFSTFITITSGKKLMFFEDLVIVEGLLGGRTEIPYTEIDTIASIGRTSKFGIKRTTGAGGLSNSNWFYIRDAKVKTRGNDWLSD